MIDKILNWIDKKKNGTQWDLFQLGAATLIVITIILKIFSLFIK